MLSIFHRGESHFRRGPLVQFFPWSTRLHVRSSVRGNWNYGHDPASPIPLRKWTHVVVQHKKGLFRVYVNGKIAVNKKAKQPIHNAGTCFCKHTLCCICSSSL